MAFVHGKGVVVTLDGDDLSAFATKVDVEREAEAHDVTTFGKTSKTYAGGLKDGTATIEGVYDGTTSTGPRAIIEALLGTTVEMVYKPEGTGTGKPVKTGDCVVTSYKESAPVADMITWTCELQLSDDLVISTGV
jgi:hypothetical protein